MENIIFNNVSHAYYWRNYEGKETDFVIREKETNTKLIQVSYIDNIKAIPPREIDNLILASKILKCNDLTLVTWSVEDTITKDNKTVKLIPLSKFVLH